jgi:hypothetical protein
VESVATTAKNGILCAANAVAQLTRSWLVCFRSDDSFQPQIAKQGFALPQPSEWPDAVAPHYACGVEQKGAETLNEGVGDLANGWDFG